MRAALLRAPGPLTVEDVPEPKCPNGGLLISVDACSICASDVKMVRMGHRDLVYPRILGHEVVGTIIESRVQGGSLRKGARVQVWPGTACGECSQCLRGNDNQCSHIGIIGFNRDGGFAERMAVPAECARVGGAVPLPDSLPSDVASLAEPLACCVNAQEALRVGEGDSVLVIGGGPLGALHLMLARRRGAASTVVMEGSGPRRETLARARPDVVIDPCSEDARAKAMDVFGSEGADVIILATPEVPADDALLGLLAPRGRVSLFCGLSKAYALAMVDFNSLHYRERTLVGSYGCRSSDNRAALELLASGDVDAGWLITKRVHLERIEEGIRHVAGREGMKATVTEL